MEKDAWWRENEKYPICPNRAQTMVERSKCSQNMPSKIKSSSRNLIKKGHIYQRNN
jgi:hypothetical protein